MKNRRSGEFGYRLDTEAGDAGGDGFESVVGLKKSCKVEFFNFDVDMQTIFGDGFHIVIIYGDAFPENIPR